MTGGAGFIGSNLVAALAERGTRVVVCDRLRDAEKWRNLRKCRPWELIAPEGLQAWLAAHGRQLDAIVHLGAISSTLERDADRIIDVNLRLSVSLWEWCAAHGVRFVYASSAATYGAGEQGFEDDATPAALARLRPLNAYGWSKHLFDCRVAGSVAAGEPVPPQWVGLKFFNVYGPNEYHKANMRSVVAQKFALAAAGEPVSLFKSYRSGVSDGAQQRDFVYVADCTEVMLWLLERPDVSGIFNLGTGRARSFEDLARALCLSLQRPSRVTYVDMPEALRSNYQYFTEAPMQRLRLAGYERPFVSLEDGVGDYVRRYLTQPDPYR